MFCREYFLESGRRWDGLVVVTFRVEKHLSEAVSFFAKVLVIAVRELIQNLRQITSSLEIESFIVDNFGTGLLVALDHVVLRPELPRGGRMWRPVVSQDGFGDNSRVRGRVALLDELTREKGERSTGVGRRSEVIL